MMPRSTDDEAPSRGGGVGDGGPTETDGPSVASSAASNTTSSSTGAPSAGVENHPSPDSAPVPVAQTFAALGDEVEKGDKKMVEEIVSSDDDAPVPVGMMDTSYAHDNNIMAAKASSKAPDDGSKSAPKSVELVGRDDEGPAPPAQLAVEDGSAATAKKTVVTMPLPRTRVAAPGDVGRGRPAPSAPMMPTVRPPPPSMLPAAAAARERAEPSVPAFHEVHATLVEDEPEQPVYDAVPIGEEHWARRHQRKIVGGFVVVIAAMAVALGVSLGAGGDGGDESTRTGIGEEDDGAATAVVATTPPTRSLSPSTQPSMHPRPCFADKEEIQAAVDSYVAGGSACWKGESECEVIQTYGWPIGSWCTSEVTSMAWLFEDKRAFDDDLSSWDTSQVTSMYGMFWGASAFNGEVSNWDTSKVTDMDGMFNEATSFDQDLSSFDTSNVTSMFGMFSWATAFNGDVSSFDTSKVTSMYAAFNRASSFNGDVSNFDTSKVTSMENMFAGAYAFNRDVSNWDTSKVTDMYRMFAGASAFNRDVSNWDTSNVTSMFSMFTEASSFDQNLCAWGVQFSTDTNYWNMFDGTSCSNQDDPAGPDTNWCAATCNSG